MSRTIRPRENSRQSNNVALLFICSDLFTWVSPYALNFLTVCATHLYVYESCYTPASGKRNPFNPYVQPTNIFTLVRQGQGHGFLCAIGFFVFFVCFWRVTFIWTLYKETFRENYERVKAFWATVTRNIFGRNSEYGVTCHYIKVFCLFTDTNKLCTIRDFGIVWSDVLKRFYSECIETRFSSLSNTTKYLNFCGAATLRKFIMFKCLFFLILYFRQNRILGGYNKRN